MVFAIRVSCGVSLPRAREWFNQKLADGQSNPRTIAGKFTVLP